MLRNKEDLTRDRDISDQQLDFTQKIDKEKKVENSRRLVTIMLFITAGLSLAFWLSRSFTGLSFALKNKFTSLMPSFSSKTISTDQKPDLDQVAAQVLDKQSGTWAYYIHLLDDSDFSWAKNENLTLTAASLIKLPLILAYYQQIDQNLVDPATIYTLDRQDFRSGAGTLQNQKVGYQISYQDLAHLCLSQSDNTAYAALLRIITPQKVNELISSLGLSSTDLEENTTSASDIGQIFEYIYTSSFLSDSSRQEIINSLTNTAFEDRFPTGLPQGIQIAHKIGTETNALSDAGLVFTPDRDFVLVLLADQVNPQKAQSVFPRFAQAIYWQLLGR
jgi:beta-lactamase class A